MNKVRFQIKLIRMDLKWELGCHNCFNPFPPSFYCTHTEEEIEQIFADLRAYIEELKEENLALEKEEALKLEGISEDKHLEEI